MTAQEDEYMQLIESSRVSSQTRTVLTQRMGVDDPAYEPKTVTPVQLLTLRLLMSRVIPQDNPEIDLAARIDSQLAERKGDGWRYASLPEDAEAFRIGLSLLDDFANERNSATFEKLHLEAQDELLSAIASGRIHSPKLDLKRWFEDLRASATQIYVAHPRTLARMAYSGFADEPDGFVRIGVGERESWEPKAR